MLTNYVSNVLINAKNVLAIKIIALLAPIIPLDSMIVLIFFVIVSQDTIIF